MESCLRGCNEMQLRIRNLLEHKRSGRTRNLTGCVRHVRLAHRRHSLSPVASWRCGGVVRDNLDILTNACKTPPHSNICGFSNAAKTTLGGRLNLPVMNIVSTRLVFSVSYVGTCSTANSVCDCCAVTRKVEDSSHSSTILNDHH